MNNKEAEAILVADRWNKTYPVGMPVEVTRDNGKKTLTFTRAGAGIVGDQAVIWLEGIRGCYALDRVRAIEEKVPFYEAVHSDVTMKPEQKIYWLYMSCKHLNSLLKEESMEGLVEGRMVHFVMPDGEHRAAVVVRVWRPQIPERPGYCNLSVFTDCGNDGPGNETGFRRETSIIYSEAKEPNTWHWIEREA